MPSKIKTHTHTHTHTMYDDALGERIAMIICSCMVTNHNCAPFIRFEVRAVGWRGVNREDLVTALVTMFGLDTNALQNTVETTEVIAAQLG